MTMTMGRMTANATIASTVSPAWYARTPATSAATLMINSRRPSIAGVANTRVSAKRGQRHADGGERGEDGMPGLDRISPSSRSMPKVTGTKQITADSARTRVRRVAGRPAGVTVIGLDRERDEHTENDHDGDVRQAERPERGDDVPRRRESTENPAQDGGCGARRVRAGAAEHRILLLSAAHSVRCSYSS